MRTLIIAVLALCCAAIAQAQIGTNRIIIYVTAAPGGACSPNAQPFRYVVSGPDVGKLYVCNTTWTLMGITSGTGTVSSLTIAGTANKIGVSGTCTITTTGTCTITIPNGVVLVAPVLGTPASGNASNLSNLPITLTTTGSSGPSTWTQGTNTLNIPQYSGGGGSGCVPSGTIGQILTDSGSGTCTSNTPTISGSTITASLTGNASTATALAANPTDCSVANTFANVIAASGNLTCDYERLPSRAVTGTSDTILSTDLSKFITYSNGSTISVTLPQGTGSFADGFWFIAKNLGVGDVVITPTTSTISGSTTITLSTGEFAIVRSDGTNYEAASNRIIQGTNVTITKARIGPTIASTVSGTGTVTVVGAGNLTSTALVTGGGTQTIQTPNASATLDSSGNLAVNSIALGGATNACDGTAGCYQLGQGTAPSGLGTTSIQHIAPTSVTSFRDVDPTSVGTTGVDHITVSSTTATHSYSAIVTADIPVALANQTSLRGNAMAAAAGDATITQTIAHGAKALDFASTATGACATVITDTATGTLTTDVIVFTTNASIKAVTGYVPAATGGFSINAYPTADTVNFEACNWTAGTVDPGSITVNWKVIR